MYDVKSHFIRSLIAAHQSVSTTNGQEELGGYFTYLTNSGTIVGKKVNVEMLNSDSDESFQNDFSERVGKGEKISIYQLAYVALEKMLAENRDLNVGNTDTKAIVLEDVTIKDLNNYQYNVESFVLFTDQITGIIPGKIQFNK